MPPGTILRDYTLESVLGHGGFGIVYLASHNQLAHRVAIKEYLPVELAVREGEIILPRSPNCADYLEDGRRRFQKEAQVLINFRHHPSIVTCLEYFEANGTAYLVMEYEEGLPLSKVLRNRESTGNPFDEIDLLWIAIPLLEGLQKVHEAGVVHRDIKPANIFVRHRDRTPVLIDFGAAKQEVAAHTKSMAPYTPGYAAFEQVGEGPLGPWTDIYAVGAVLWRMVAGGKPPAHGLNPVKVESRMAAKMRQQDDPLPSAYQLGSGRFSQAALKAIDQCLALLEDERIRDCRALLRLFADAQYFYAQGFYRLYQSCHETDTAERAANWYRKAADRGHPEAQFCLGRMFWRGEGVAQNFAEALQWFRKAADQGLANAQDALGFMYGTGKGVVQNYAEAAQWYRKAADQGLAQAQCILGVMHAEGEGVVQNHAEAAQWYRKAADQGLAQAQCILGFKYLVGEGVPADAEEAVQWYLKAAYQDHAEAQFVLGTCYQQGDGAPRNIQEAHRWYLKAAYQDHPEAQFILGLMYWHGEGVARNHAKADQWFRQAADQGHAGAHSALERGAGLERPVWWP